MKTIKLLVPFLMISANLFSQNTEVRVLNSFNKLKVNCEAKVFATQGTENKIQITASGIDLNNIITEVKSNTLNIELKRGVYVNTNIEIYLTFSEIVDLSIGSFGNISFQTPLKGRNLKINANTNGVLQTELKLNLVDINIAQGASVRLNGSARKMTGKVSSGGILAALELTTDSTLIKVGSAATAKVNASLLLDAKVKTGGNLTITGSPKEKKVKTGIGVTINEVD